MKSRNLFLLFFSLVSLYWENVITLEGNYSSAQAWHNVLTDTHHPIIISFWLDNYTIGKYTLSQQITIYSM